MWKAYMQTTAASEIMCQRQGQTCLCVGSYLSRTYLMSPWNQQHPSFSSILPHWFPRGALPTEVPGDLPGGINKPACSTWGHLVCMRAAETSVWSDQCSTACVGQRPSLPVAPSYPANPSLLELGTWNKGCDVHPYLVCQPRTSSSFNNIPLCASVSIKFLYLIETFNTFTCLFWSSWVCFCFFWNLF